MTELKILTIYPASDGPLHTAREETVTELIPTKLKTKDDNACFGESFSQRGTCSYNQAANSSDYLRDRPIITVGHKTLIDPACMHGIVCHEVPVKA